MYTEPTEIRLDRSAQQRRIAPGQFKATSTLVLDEAFAAVDEYAFRVDVPHEADDRCDAAPISTTIPASQMVHRLQQQLKHLERHHRELSALLDGLS